MARLDPTDFERKVIQPLLPTKVRGVMRAGDRRVPSGIFRRLGTGHPGPTFRRAMVPARPA
jgi:transposase